MSILITLLIYIIIFAIIYYIAVKIMELLGVQPPVTNIVLVILLLIALIMVVSLFFGTGLDVPRLKG